MQGALGAMTNMRRVGMCSIMALVISSTASSGQLDYSASNQIFRKMEEEGLIEYWSRCQEMKNGVACRDRCYAEFG
jgi:hypothetical protein